MGLSFQEDIKLKISSRRQGLVSSQGSLMCLVCYILDPSTPFLKTTGNKERFNFVYMSFRLEENNSFYASPISWTISSSNFFYYLSSCILNIILST